MSVPKNRVPIDFLKQNIFYDSAAEILIWKENHLKSPQWNAKYSNKKVSCPKNDKGYHLIKLKYNGKRYNLTVHRVIWALIKNEWPSHTIDHKDNNKSNNKIENLRIATVGENNKNKPSTKNSTSKYKGITWKLKENKWYVAVKVDGKSKHFGIFDDEIAAAIAYNETAKKCHGEFAYINIIDGYTNKEYPNKPRGWKPE
jgi:uncharacterized ubiquitin-like protein YukD